MGPRLRGDDENYSAACAASDKLSSEEMMCSASASASAELSCALRTSPMRQLGRSGKPSDAGEHAHAGTQPGLRQHRYRETGEHGGGDGAGIRA